MLRHTAVCSAGDDPAYGAHHWPYWCTFGGHSFYTNPTTVQITCGCIIAILTPYKLNVYNGYGYILFSITNDSWHNCSWQARFPIIPRQISCRHNRNSCDVFARIAVRHTIYGLTVSRGAVDLHATPSSKETAWLSTRNLATSCKKTGKTWS